MTTPLFRTEALEHRKDRLFGEVILLNPISMTVLVSIVMFICVMLLVILFWGTYARKETVRGYLIPDKGIVKTYTYQPGTVFTIHVKEGDEVTLGQPLITMLTERALQGGANLENIQLQEIETSQKQIQENIENQKALMVNEGLNLQAQISSLKKEAEQIDQTIRNQEQRIKLFETRVNAAKQLLDKKHISKNDFEKLSEDLLAVKNEYQNLLNSKSKNQSALGQTQIALQQLPINTKNRITELETKISELKRTHTEIKGHKSFEIRSPIDGLVTALEVRQGQWQMTNLPLLAIIPKNATLQAELLLPSRAIGFINKGQIVRLRYDAFPYQRFGIYEGKVTDISKHAMLPQELAIPIESKEPIYRVIVQLNNQNVKAYGKALPLQAGMTVEADIILENRTLFQWILDPVLSVKGKF